MGPLTSLGVSVGSQLAGSLIGKIFGGGSSATKQSDLNREFLNYQALLQKDYDSGVIQRRVADAKAAGVSPMAALGMTPSGGMGLVGGNFDFQAMEDNSIGQDVGRAIAANADPMVRMNQRLATAQIEGQELDNEFKRSQIMKQYGMLPPSMPGIINDGRVQASDDPSAPVSLIGTHLSNGPILDINTFDWDSDPIGYLAGRGVVSAHDLGYFLRDIGRRFKTWHHNRSMHSKYSKRVFPEGR